MASWFNKAAEQGAIQPQKDVLKAASTLAYRSQSLKRPENTESTKGCRQKPAIKNEQQRTSCW